MGMRGKTRAGIKIAMALPVLPSPIPHPPFPCRPRRTVTYGTTTPALLGEEKAHLVLSACCGQSGERAQSWGHTRAGRSHGDRAV